MLDKKVCGEVDQAILAYGDCDGIDEEIFNNRKGEILELLGMTNNIVEVQETE